MNAPTMTSETATTIEGSGRRLPIVVPVLAVGTFLMITTEFVIAGILPEVAADLHVRSAVPACSSPSSPSA